MEEETVVSEYIAKNQKYILLTAAVSVIAAFILGFCIRAFAEDGVIISKREDQVYATLRDAGYSHAGTCGIMGNMAVENPKFEADLEANKGVTYGLFQWSDVGNRRSNLVRWCNNRLLHPNRIDGQLAFAMYELSGGDSIACRANEYLMETSDPVMAAQEFAAGFERCVGRTGNAENDSVYYGDIYPEYYGRTYQALGNRIERAKFYYMSYGESAPTSEQGIEINIVPTAGILAEVEDAIEISTYRSLNMIIPEKEDHPIGARIICLCIGYFFGMTFLPHIFRRRKGVSNFKEVNRMFDRKDPATIARIRHTLFVLIWDVIKCYLAFAVAFNITKGTMGRDVILWTGLGVILGNDYPVWNRFKGGMGSTVTMLVLITYMPLWGSLCCFLGLITALISKSLPIGVFMITLFTVPFAFFLRGATAGIFVTIEMVMMLVKQSRYIIRLVEQKIIPERKHRRRVPVRHGM